MKRGFVASTSWLPFFSSSLYLFRKFIIFNIIILYALFFSFRVTYKERQLCHMQGDQSLHTLIEAFPASFYVDKDGKKNGCNQKKSSVIVGLD